MKVESGKCISVCVCVCVCVRARVCMCVCVCRARTLAHIHEYHLNKDEQKSVKKLNEHAESRISGSSAELHHAHQTQFFQSHTQDLHSSRSNWLTILVSH